MWGSVEEKRRGSGCGVRRRRGRCTLMVVVVEERIRTTSRRGHGRQLLHSPVCGNPCPPLPINLGIPCPKGLDQQTRFPRPRSAAVGDWIANSKPQFVLLSKVFHRNGRDRAVHRSFQLPALTRTNNTTQSRVGMAVGRRGASNATVKTGYPPTSWAWAVVEGSLAPCVSDIRKLARPAMASGEIDHAVSLPLHGSVQRSESAPPETFPSRPRRAGARDHRLCHHQESNVARCQACQKRHRPS